LSIHQQNDGNWSGTFWGKGTRNANEITIHNYTEAQKYIDVWKGANSATAEMGNETAEKEEDSKKWFLNRNNLTAEHTKDTLVWVDAPGDSENPAPSPQFFKMIKRFLMFRITAEGTDGKKVVAPFYFAYYGEHDGRGGWKMTHIQSSLPIWRGFPLVFPLSVR
jgi:hypothetical protein